MIERLAIPAGHRLHPDRRLYLTASDMGAASGMSAWKTPLALYCEKTGLKPAPTMTPMMDRGIMFEPVVEAYVRREMPDWRIIDPRVFLVDTANRIGATPDRLMEDPDTRDFINLQLKVVGKPAFERWEGELPIEYQLQLACEALLLDAHSSVLAALVVSNFEAELEIFTQPRHAAAEERIFELAREFWHRVDNRLPPPADYASEPELVRELHPVDHAVPVPLDLSGDNRIGELLEDRERHKAAEKAAHAAAKAIDAEIVEKMNGAAVAELPGWRIKQVSVDVKEHVQAAYSYTYPSIRRVA